MVLGFFFVIISWVGVIIFFLKMRFLIVKEVNIVFIVRYSDSRIV